MSKKPTRVQREILTVMATYGDAIEGNCYDHGEPSVGGVSDERHLEYRTFNVLIREGWIRDYPDGPASERDVWFITEAGREILMRSTNRDQE